MHKASNIIGPIVVLSTMPTIYHTCRYLLSTESINSCCRTVSVTVSITSIINCDGAVESCYTGLTAIFQSIYSVNSTVRDFCNNPSPNNAKLHLFEQGLEKACLKGFQPGPTQTGLTATEDGWRLEIEDLESKVSGIAPSM